MTEWFKRRNQQVIDALPRERLLVFSPKEGWKPLCTFLGVPVPDAPFPRVNSRDEIREASQQGGGLPPDPETGERFAREYIDAAEGEGVPRRLGLLRSSAYRAFAVQLNGMTFSSGRQTHERLPSIEVVSDSGSVMTSV